MNYEQMPTRELQEECRRRGLPSGRIKAELVARLTEADEAGDGSAEDDFVDDIPQQSTPEAPGETVATVEEPAATPPSGAVVSSVFHLDFPAEPGGPHEEDHARYRQATIQAAADAGLVPRGDARLAATVDGRWVYEVLVRQAI